ncbi:MAG: hypothetical protein M1480_11150 [Bacteroidetes bacterium]|nr:hypothetical protein [Bacteroidota bacterium]
MKRNLLFFAVTLLSIVFINGCKKDNTVAPADSQYNNPTIANTQNSFAYSVDAQGLSYSVTLPLQFKNTTLLNEALTITDFKNGSGRIAIYDTTGNAIMDQKMTGPTTYTNEYEIFVQPQKITISFIGFTGKVSMAFSGK